MGKSFTNTKVLYLLEFHGLALVAQLHLESLLDPDEHLEPIEENWHFTNLENVLPEIQSRCSCFLDEDQRLRDGMHSEPIPGSHDNTLLAIGAYEFHNLFDDALQAISGRDIDCTGIVDGFGKEPINILFTMAEAVEHLEEAISNSLRHAYNEPRDQRFGDNRLEVTLEPPIATFMGKPFPLKPDGAIFLKVLKDKKGDWASGNDFSGSDFDDLEHSFRSDRAKKSLPKPLRDIVESKVGKGHRLLLKPLA